MVLRPASLAQDILPSSEELYALFKRSSCGEEQCQLDKAGLHLLEHRTSLQVKSIQGLVDQNSLKAWYFMPQHCPLGSHTTNGCTRRYVPSDQVVISPFSLMATLPSIAGTLGSLSLSSTMSYTM